MFRWFFKRIGSGVQIIRPLRIQGFANIAIGDDVIVQSHGWLAALPHCGGSAELEIGSRSRIGQFNQIYATRSVRIGEAVLTGDRVYIADNSHRYEDISQPVRDQGVQQLSPVVIGDGTWIGANAAVIGASIGRNCVVGANAVVKNDVPDYCVVAGAPARIIRRYDPRSGRWIRTSSQTTEVTSAVPVPFPRRSGR
jgi:acetyltransferase-like isoleucine patch superfamily enzyme